MSLSIFAHRMWKILLTFSIIAILGILIDIQKIELPIGASLFGMVFLSLPLAEIIFEHRENEKYKKLLERNEKEKNN